MKLTLTWRSFVKNGYIYSITHFHKKVKRVCEHSFCYMLLNKNKATLFCSVVSISISLAIAKLILKYFLEPKFISFVLYSSSSILKMFHGVSIYI